MTDFTFTYRNEEEKSTTLSQQSLLKRRKLSDTFDTNTETSGTLVFTDDPDLQTPRTIKTIDVYLKELAQKDNVDIDEDANNIKKAADKEKVPK